MKRLFQLLSAQMIFAVFALASNASFAFDPFGGALSGTPGSTVGWGFTISDPVEYVVLDLTDFCPAGLSNPADFYCTNGPNGIYTDFAFNAPIAGPAPYSTSVTENFDAVLQTGYGSFAISNTAGVGTVISDQIYVMYDLYSGDPAAGGALMSQDNLAMLDASVTVVSDSPEPGTLLPAGLAIASLLLWRNRRSWTSAA
jgi:hypothetical protein